jgi:uncharacterized protein YjdB
VQKPTDMGYMGFFYNKDFHVYAFIFVHSNNLNKASFQNEVQQAW